MRKANGISPFLSFIDSLHRFPPPADCKLVFIFKGFDTNDVELKNYLRVLSAFNFETIYVSDAGYDITAYFHAAELTHFRYLIFFNSFSVILHQEWFTIFKNNFSEPQTGMLAATGSFESAFTNHLQQGSAGKSLVQKLRYWLKCVFLYLMFPPFPNPHLRSNAFMVRRKDFLGAKRRLRTKMQALIFESGRNGLSIQILKKDKKILLLSRSGEGLEPHLWPKSGIFRQGKQENLLISDNQTRVYEQASLSDKNILNELAWGPNEIASFQKPLNSQGIKP